MPRRKGWNAVGECSVTSRHCEPSLRVPVRKTVTSIVLYMYIPHSKRDSDMSSFGKNIEPEDALIAHG